MTAFKSKFAGSTNAFKERARQKTGDFTAIPNDVAKEARLTPIEFRVLSFLSCYEPIFPSRYDIMNGTGCDERQVSAALKGLVAIKAIDIAKGRSGKNSEYKINDHATWNFGLARLNRVGRGSKLEQKQKTRIVGKPKATPPNHQVSSVVYSKTNVPDNPANTSDSKVSNTPNQAVHHAHEQAVPIKEIKREIKNQKHSENVPIKEQYSLQEKLSTNSCDAELINKRTNEISEGLPITKKSLEVYSQGSYPDLMDSRLFNERESNSESIRYDSTVKPLIPQRDPSYHELVAKNSELEINQISEQIKAQDYEFISVAKVYGLNFNHCDQRDLQLDQNRLLSRINELRGDRKKDLGTAYDAYGTICCNCDPLAEPALEEAKRLIIDRQKIGATIIGLLAEAKNSFHCDDWKYWHRVVTKYAEFLEQEIEALSLT